MTPATTLLTIDLKAVAENYRILKTRARGAKVAGVVKANAYGLGADRIAPILVGEGCDEFFVATAEEGAALRAMIGADPVIAVLGGLPSGDLGIFTAHRLVPVLNNIADIDLWYAVGGGGPAILHVDTGMNRLGLSAEETRIVIDDPRRLTGMNIPLVMSHYACADEPGHPLTFLQAQRFAQLRGALGNYLPNARWSLANSAALFGYGDDLYDLVRPGYALYGGNPLPGQPNPMRPVAALSVRLLQTHNARQGETAGYGATYRLERDSRLGIAGIGYADGFPRALSGEGFMYWQGKKLPVIGRVSMDLTIIDLTGITGLPPQTGDMLEILGPSQDVDTLAAQAQTIGYEILTTFGRRHTRVYV